jgi:hypothetical protein
MVFETATVTYIISDGGGVTSLGRQFQTAGPAIANARGLMVTHRELGMTSLSAAATDDRRPNRPG